MKNEINKPTNRPTNRKWKRIEQRMEKIHNNKMNISVKVEHFAFAQALCYLCCAKWNVKCESMYENIQIYSAILVAIQYIFV